MRTCLYGTQFTVITDHHPLCWLNKHKSENERLYRWSLILQEYEFDIKHKSGSCHLDADCLSRSVSSDNSTEDANFDEHDEDTIPVHNEFRPYGTANNINISQNNAVQTRAQTSMLNQIPSTSISKPETISASIESNCSISKPGFDYMKIPQHQLTDPLIQQRIHDIQQNPSRYSSFVVEHGIL